ncbi:hypothetical protein A1Q2_00568 [Trichosporon asahii var. asahii CBS 8904]|uniref:F-box domain-containing protein n=2 Tax=Trichosporon asahii var. asahii TaxID=189963 RepID=K1VI14_TRIAC|nr:hypothetical protein A1Q1_03970 [Trichosporon asahii var. asahii CBS 2479]EJT52454.1 hypothetical protein A1Q1_03970 [Trichosporon asahii var. asahii CBS 2479]EKD00466.1 hypothetical protein A1Q2_05303 [Trichosporon asahii var. asahii CBS 8904]EKD05147.1 hypothetical protein A1Q2_00568 [Trichosporon asahii var. asahii CBS 8904]
MTKWFVTPSQLLTISLLATTSPSRTMTETAFSGYHHPEIIFDIIDHADYACFPALRLTCRFIRAHIDLKLQTHIVLKRTALGQYHLASRLLRLWSMNWNAKWSYNVNCIDYLVDDEEEGIGLDETDVKRELVPASVKIVRTIPLRFKADGPDQWPELCNPITTIYRYPHWTRGHMTRVHCGDEAVRSSRPILVLRAPLDATIDIVYNEHWDSAELCILPCDAEPLPIAVGGLQSLPMISMLAQLLSKSTENGTTWTVVGTEHWDDLVNVQNDDRKSWAERLLTAAVSARTHNPSPADFWDVNGMLTFLTTDAWQEGPGKKLWHLVDTVHDDLDIGVDN